MKLIVTVWTSDKMNAFKKEYINLVIVITFSGHLAVCTSFWSL